MRVAVLSDRSRGSANSNATYAERIVRAARAVGIDAVEIPIPVRSGFGAYYGRILHTWVGKVRRDGFDVVHSTTYTVGRGVDVQTIYDLCPWIDPAQGRVGPVERVQIRTVARRAKRIIVISSFTWRYAGAYLGRVVVKKTRLVTIPVEASAGTIGTQYDTCWVGFHVPKKRFGMFAQLSRDIPGLQQVARINGYNREAEPDWVAAAAGSGSRLEIRTTPMSEDEMDAMYRSSRCYVCTSAPGAEGFCMPPLEAYLRGTPVVLPRQDPFLETYEYGDAAGVYWYDPADYSDLRDKVRAAIAGPRGIVPNPRVVADHSYEVVGRALKAIYEEVLRK